MNKSQPRRKQTGLACHSQLGDEIRRHIKEGVRAGHLLLLVLEALADGMPFSVSLGADHVLVAIAFEVNHVVVFFELIKLDVKEDPDTVRDFWESAWNIDRGGPARETAVGYGGLVVSAPIFCWGRDARDVEAATQFFEVAAAIVNTGGCPWSLNAFFQQACTDKPWVLRDVIVGWEVGVFALQGLRLIRGRGRIGADIGA